MSCDLSEGLKANALDHLVLPMISIDEYESKINDRRVIVVGFFVFDKDPAHDLSNFIDGGTSDVLDTDVSPAPTPDGYYLVFVEIMRNKNFPKVLLKILSELKNLCTIDSWQMVCPGQLDPVDVDNNSLDQHLVLDVSKMPFDQNHKKSKKANSLKEENFWQDSCVDNIIIENETITFFKNNKSYRYQQDKNIPIAGINFDQTQQAKHLQHLLGPTYNVWQMRDRLVVEHVEHVKVLTVLD